MMKKIKLHLFALCATLVLVSCGGSDDDPVFNNTSAVYKVVFETNRDDFTDEDIQKLSDTFTAFQDGMLEDVKGFCAVADLKEIEKQDFILTPGRYVGIEEVEDDGEPFEQKMTRLTSELSDMFAKSHELEEEIRKKLGAIGYEV